jgi:hypothetical protein
MMQPGSSADETMTAMIDEARQQALKNHTLKQRVFGVM